MAENLDYELVSYFLFYVKLCALFLLVPTYKNRLIFQWIVYFMFQECEEALRAMQPDEHFRDMVSVLKKFLHFMNLTATVGRALPHKKNLWYAKTILIFFCVSS